MNDETILVVELFELVKDQREGFLIFRPLMQNKLAERERKPILYSLSRHYRQ